MKDFHVVEITLNIYIINKRSSFRPWFVRIDEQRTHLNVWAKRCN